MLSLEDKEFEYFKELLQYEGQQARIAEVKDVANSEPPRKGEEHKGGEHFSVLFSPYSMLMAQLLGVITT